MTKPSHSLLPGWMVLALDFLVFFHASILSYFAISDFNFSLLASSGFLAGGILFATIATFSCYLLKNHLLSADDNLVQEVLSILRTLIVSTVMIAIFSFVDRLIFGLSLLPGSRVISIGLGVSLFGLTFTRMALRQGVDYLSQTHQVQKNILIIAHNASQAMSRRVLKNAGFPLHFIQAYVSENFTESGRKILGPPIYENLDELHKVIARHKITEVFISEEGLSLEEKRTYINACLQNGIHPSLLTPSNEWDINEGEYVLKKAVIEDYLTQEAPVEKATSSKKHFFSNKTVMITAAGSKLGSELCRQLIYQNPAHIIIIDRSEAAIADLSFRIKQLKLKSHVTTAVIDIRNKGRVRALFEAHRPELVYHAALFHDPAMMEVYAEEAVRANVLTTKNLSELALEYDVEKFILISSHQAVNPTEIIGASKKLAEMYVKYKNDLPSFAPKTQFMTVRHGEVLGVNDQSLQKIKSEVRNGDTINIHHPDTTHQYFTSSQTCKFILTASQIGKGGEIYTMEKNSPIKLVELVKKTVQLNEGKISTELKVHYNKHLQPKEAFPLFDERSEKLKRTHVPQLTRLQPLTENNFDISEKIDELEDILKNQDTLTLHKFFKSVIPAFVSDNNFVELSNRLN
ncbi:polysaccharide biosynthesis protein [Litoribacter populi]|uniref:polysaccharide biosynthesis protein n=1 Tax=Litoribacter populi TaxID=2598460 RepID=UPI00117C9DF6|nr:polysaccharide biosynthesis protein [Litoribacter populi]